MSFDHLKTEPLIAQGLPEQVYLVPSFQNRCVMCAGLKDGVIICERTRCARPKDGGRKDIIAIFEGDFEEYTKYMTLYKMGVMSYEELRDELEGYENKRRDA